MQTGTTAIIAGKIINTKELLLQATKSQLHPLLLQSLQVTAPGRRIKKKNRIPLTRFCVHDLETPIKKKQKVNTRDWV